MLQFRLSTIFLLFFVLAASLAAFDLLGIGVFVLLLLATVCLNRAKKLRNGIALTSSLIVTITGIWFYVSSKREAALQDDCQALHLSMIGWGVYDYEARHKEFPPLCVRDEEGRPLRSWLVEILPGLDYDRIYRQMKKNEPWNSSYNAQVLPGTISEYICPKASREKNDCSSNYMAIIGPGTIWKAGGAKKRSDLPNNIGEDTVVAVETINAGKHWAEPFAITVDEVLENMRTQKGPRISTCHRKWVNVVFADCSVGRFPTKMPLSIWRKILSGERIDDLSQIDPNAPDMVDTYAGPSVRQLWMVILCITVWLFSVVLLFFKVVKGRNTIKSLSEMSH